jgi:hypothetical protein
MELLATTVTRTTIHIAIVDMHHMDMRPAHMGPMGLHMGRPMGTQTLSQSALGASAPTIRRARLISRTAVSGFNVRSEPGKRCRQTLELLTRLQSCGLGGADLNTAPPVLLASACIQGPLA